MRLGSCSASSSSPANGQEMVKDVVHGDRAQQAAELVTDRHAD
jgi:hypothetical protein